MKQKEPLYRKKNKRALHYSGDKGDDYANTRHAKKTANEMRMHIGMGGKQQRGRDYTPLYKFLLSKVGEDWDEVFSEAVSRLDKPEPIFYLVAKTNADKKTIVRGGDSAYYSGLFVDENNILQVVNPNIVIEQLWPYCSCCTHTFNGQLFVNKHDPEKSELINEMAG